LYEDAFTGLGKWDSNAQCFALLLLLAALPLTEPLELRIKVGKVLCVLKKAVSPESKTANNLVECNGSNFISTSKLFTVISLTSVDDSTE
jgi:hypothetical protein